MLGNLPIPRTELISALFYSQHKPEYLLLLTLLKTSYIEVLGWHWSRKALFYYLLKNDDYSFILFCLTHFLNICA